MRNSTCVNIINPLQTIHLYGTYIKADGIQIHLCEFDVFVLFSCLSAFSQEKPIGHPPIKHESNYLMSQNRQKLKLAKYLAMKSTYMMLAL